MPSQSLCPLGTEEVNSLHAACQEFDTKLGRLIQNASDDLHTLIGTLAGEDKLALIQLRRDIHNRRWNRVAEAEARLADRIGLPVPVSGTLRVQGELGRMQQSLEEAIERYLQRRYLALHRDFSAAAAVKGLSLSAPQSWMHILKPDGVPFSRSALSQRMFTLMRYVSRCAAKTSPFSYFGPSAYGFFSESEELPGDWEPRSYAQVNSNLLVKHLTRALDHGETGHRDLQWNTSVQRTLEGFVWLAHSGTSATISEINAKGNEELAALLDTVVKAHAEGSQPPEPRTLPADVLAALRKVGLCVAGNGYFARVTEELGRYAVVRAEAGNETTETRYADALRQNMLLFRAGDLTQRQDALDRVVSCLRELWNSAIDPADETQEASAFPRSYRTIVREDVVMNRLIRMSPASLADPLEQISRFQRAFSPLEGAHIARKTLGALYKQSFGERDRVPLLVYLKMLFARCHAQVDAIKPPGRLVDHLFRIRREHYKDLNVAAIRGIEDALKQHWTLDREANRVDLTAAVDALNSGRTSSAPSVSCAYLQRGQCSGVPLWVLNMSNAGSGKEVKRWFSYETSFYRGYKEWMNAHLAGADVLHVGIPDDVYHHLDRGPRLFDHLFEIPGLIPLDIATHPVHISECHVRNDSDGLLQLESAAGQVIYAHYDSLLNNDLRSLTVQFLRLFGSANDEARFQNLESVLKKLPVSYAQPIGNGVAKYPRVVLGQSLVLGRAKWIIAAANLQVFRKLATKQEIIRRYANWVNDLGLPRRVFAKCIRQPDDPKTADSTKPQYIDWTDPAWVLFFHRYTLGAHHGVSLEEALPDPVENCGNESTRVAEHIVHWSA